MVRRRVAPRQTGKTRSPVFAGPSRGRGGYWRLIMKNLAGLLAILLGVCAGPSLAQTDEDLINDPQTPRGRARPQHGVRPQELQPARGDQQVEHPPAGAHLEHEPDEPVGRVGRAGDLRRRALRDQRELDLRHRPGDRPPDLAHAGSTRRGIAAAQQLQPRRAGRLRRPPVPGDGRQPRSRAGHGDRRGAVEPEVRRRGGGATTRRALR